MPLTTASFPAFIYLTAYLGPGDANKQLILQYQSANSLTAGFTVVSTQQVAIGGTNIAFNLATLFPATSTPQFVSILDITSPGVGFNIGTVSATGLLAVGASGFWSYLAGSALALPTVYITNTSATSVLDLQFGYLGT
jgi:hypothetical protein